MSPVIAAASRSAARVAGRRQFSLLMSMRNIARSFEPHPFQRLPVSHTPARPDYMALLKRVSGQTVIFVPTFAAILGWPYLASEGLDGHVH